MSVSLLSSSDGEMMAFPIHSGCLCPMLHLQHPLRAIPSANSVPIVRFEKEEKKSGRERYLETPNRITRQDPFGI